MLLGVLERLHYPRVESVREIADRSQQQLIQALLAPDAHIHSFGLSADDYHNSSLPD